MYLPEQKCPRLPGLALRRENDTEGEKHCLLEYEIFAGMEPSPHLRASLFDPKTETASDVTFANFSRSTMHLVKTKNRNTNYESR
jgi:hypothetical protein